MNIRRFFLISAALCAAVSASAQTSALDELRSAAGSAAVAPAPATPLSAPRAAAPAPLAGPVLPDELTVHERIISLTDTFDLKAGGAKFGTITEKFFSLTKAFTYVDAKDACAGKARARLLSWGTYIDVTDCSDRPIGAIKENVLKSWFKTWTTYSILDAQGREIASSEKVEWISTDLTIRRPDGRTIATLHRPWLNVLSDNWSVKIADHAAVDSRIIVLIAAYKTSVDNDRRAEEDDKKKDDDKDR
jgi:uncharacterized protein YxjI